MFTINHAWIVVDKITESSCNMQSHMIKGKLKYVTKPGCTYQISGMILFSQYTKRHKTLSIVDWYFFFYLNYFVAFYHNVYPGRWSTTVIKRHRSEIKNKLAMLHEKRASSSKRDVSWNSKEIHSFVTLPAPFRHNITCQKREFTVG